MTGRSNPRVLLLVGFLLLSPLLKAQGEEKENPFGIEEKVKVEATSVKDQEKTGTCWSFATSSFLESESMRMGNGAYDLSEMFFVHHVYLEKGKRYVRFHGNINFGQGSLSHDLIRMVEKYGAVPQEVYPGYIKGKKEHEHGELEAVLKGYLDGVIANKDGQLSQAWMDGYRSILDSYLGAIPQKFEHNGKTYTPKSFASEKLGLKGDDYVELTSFTHHPFYEEFVLEIPDNFTHQEYQNIKLKEMEKLIDNALEQGYTVAWDGDVSEPGFGPYKGLAVLPATPFETIEDEDKKALFEPPLEEYEVDQEIRQEGFDNYSTTDDHLMHIVGISEDENGNKFYRIKNSWGRELGVNGHVHMSRNYLLMKTVGIMVHKEAIPKELSKKLSFE